MKRSYSAIALCLALLICEAAVFLPSADAKQDVLIQLLDLPAPPPPNPLVTSRERDESFYDIAKPPPDNAPIQDLVDYWSRQNAGYRGSLYYMPKPSPAVTARLLAEMAQRPEISPNLLQVLEADDRSVDAIRRIYESNAPREGDEESGETGSEFDRSSLGDWLRHNSDYFADDLVGVTRGTQDNNGYIDLARENDVLALTTYAWDRARPLVEQMYVDHSQPVTQVLATWALYKHALATNSLSDIDRYRTELMRTVEDRSLPDGVRDKANDAITHEADFPGRDEWSWSLFEDETLVNMQRFTMLTTLIMYSPPEKYVERMCDILDRTSNPVVRTAAVNNLIVAMSRGISAELEREAIISMLPWLEDKKWAVDKGASRSTLVSKLAVHQIPESVPALIKLLDEKEARDAPTLTNGNANIAANAAASAVRAAANAAGAAANAANSAAPRAAGATSYYYPLRSDAVRALARQRSQIAVPALRRILPESERYEAMTIVGAILACGGYTIQEQIAALDAIADGVSDQAERVESGMAFTNAASNTSVMSAATEVRAVTLTDGSMGKGLAANTADDDRLTEAAIRQIIGVQLLQMDDISDDLARAIVDRIESLDTRDPRKAAAFRTIALRWPHRTINSLFLRDVKNDRASIGTLVLLMSKRKQLLESQSSEIADLRRGQAFAAGFGACLIEDPHDMDSILTSGDTRAAASLLACSRMIRAPLDVHKVINLMNGGDKQLSLAAERYLEAEDSPAARGAVLARHPNEARILGASTAFFVEGAPALADEVLGYLYRSVGVNSLYFGWGSAGVPDDLKAIENSLKKEVLGDNGPLGLYAFDRNYVRIYRDRVIFSWDEDDSRYRERPLTEYEFETLRTYMAENQVDELPPFLLCGGDYCDSRELIMLSRAGGRRVFLAGESPPFFAGLEKIFAEWKQGGGDIKYALSRDLPGLELVLADENLHAETVWKNGQDLRVAVEDLAAGKRTAAEVKKAARDARANAGEDDEGEYEGYYSPLEWEMLSKRKFESYSWRQVANGTAGAPAVQPDGIEIIPHQDSHAVRATQQQWKARSPGIEIRAGSEGLFKLAGGKLTKIKDGSWSSPVITPNGKWLVVSPGASEEDDGPAYISRIDLTTGREYKVETEEYYQYHAVAYVASLNKVLVVRESYDYYEGEESDDTVDRDPMAEEMFLLDPATGQKQPVRGEFRPLTQQTFRSLQPASKPGEYWAAIADLEKNVTEVGIYDTRVFGFNAVLRIPKMAFNSMAMWVDEGENSVYFVYRGHLLKLPLSKPDTPPKP